MCWAVEGMWVAMLAMKSMDAVGVEVLEVGVGGHRGVRLRGAGSDHGVCTGLDNEEGGLIFEGELRGS